MALVEDFVSLFPGFMGNHGICCPDRPKKKQIWTANAPVTREKWEAHLKSEPVTDFKNRVLAWGLVIVPVNNDGKCKFGVLDFDIHFEGCTVDLNKLDSFILEKRWPFLLCRSRSGSAHLYLFLKEFIQAPKMKKLLAYFKNELEVYGSENFISYDEQIYLDKEKPMPDIEIFPKQNKMTANLYGNGINLPYLGGLKPQDPSELDRYCIHDNVILSLKGFIELAEKSRIGAHQINFYMENNHDNAPPCVLKMMKHGYSTNNGYYQAGVYLKNRFETEIEKRLLEIWEQYNKDLNENDPFKAQDIIKIARSVQNNKEYHYKCNENPMAELCDKQICLTRKYGISGDNVLPNIGPIKMLNTVPPIWKVFVNGNMVEVSAAQLMSYRLFRLAVLEQIQKIIPMLKDKQWTKMITDIINNNLEIIKAPREASIEGEIEELLWEFLNQADRHFPTDEKEMKHRDVIMLGRPLIQWRKEEKVIYFKKIDFRKFLRDIHRINIAQHTLFNILSKIGVENTTLRINESDVKSKTIRVLYMKYDENRMSEIVYNFDLPDKEF